MWLFYILFFGVIWGIVTNKILENKGYDDNWFWWGFFFGIFAVIVAASKPKAPESTPVSYYHFDESSNSGNGRFNISRGGYDKNDSWKCRKCGRINPLYTGTCACGNTKYSQSRPAVTPAPATTTATSQIVIPATISVSEKSETVDKFSQIKEYKELLDVGIITQEEFDKKKKELLDI